MEYKKFNSTLLFFNITSMIIINNSLILKIFSPSTIIILHENNFF